MPEIKQLEKKHPRYPNWASVRGPQGAAHRSAERGYIWETRTCAMSPNKQKEKLNTHDG